MFIKILSWGVFIKKGLISFGKVYVWIISRGSILFYRNLRPFLLVLDVFDHYFTFFILILNLLLLHVEYFL